MSKASRYGADRDVLASRVRKASAAALIGVVAVALILWAATADGFLRELTLQLGGGLLLLLVAGLWLDRFLREYRVGATHVHMNLPFEVLIRNLRKSRQSIRILTTWTGLLESKYREDCLSAFRTALAAGAEVKVLLVDPDGEAAEQRTREANSLFDTSDKVMENLRVLDDFKTLRLTGSERDRLEVRLYSVMPGVQMYGWDDKAYISFYPLGQVTYDSSKLETFMSTPLGAFVAQRFEELWRSADKTMDQYMRARVTIWNDAGLDERCEISYVRHDATYYVGGGDLEMRIIEPELSSVFVNGDGLFGANHNLRRLPEGNDGDDELATVLRLFHTKYGTSPRLLFRLVSP